MKPFPRFFSLFSLLFLFISLAAAPRPSRAAQEFSETVFPQSLEIVSGAAAGSVSSLAAQDQSGAQDTPANYILLRGRPTPFSGDLAFTLPETVKRAGLLELTIRVNFRGPKLKERAWTFLLYDWSKGEYARAGWNMNAGSAQWGLLTFKVQNPARFMNASRQVKLRIQASQPLRGLKSLNNPADARVDFVSLTARANPVNGPTLEGCPLFPDDNIWNTPVDSLPVHARSEAWIDSIGRNTGFHMDFGSGTWDGGPIGIPYNLADSSTPKYTFTFYYPGESDPGPYPIPEPYQREWGSDHHILVVEKDNCILYEVYDASKTGSTWNGGSGATWDLRSNALRPAGWTSADAAGLPILPGLVRYDEIENGEIRHAIRFTASSTNSYIWPARHLTSGSAGTLTNTPPMGARFRLKASYDISGFPVEMRVILQAMKTYGILLADNGSDWYISGTPDERWDNDMLHLLDVLTGDDFEAVDVSSLLVDPDSGQAGP
jgi:hypothetical protein